MTRRKTQKQGHQPPKTTAVTQTTKTIDAVMWRLENGRYAGKPMGLPGVTLRALCTRLIDESKTVAETHRWLGKQRGAKQCPVSRNSLHAFARHVRQLKRLALASGGDNVATKTPTTTAKLTEATQKRLLTLCYTRLETAVGMDELPTKTLKSTIDAIRDVQTMRLRDREMKLKIAENKRRETELTAELAKADVEKEILRQKAARLPERIDAITSRLDKIAQGQASGKRIDPIVLDAIRDELVSLAQEHRPPPETPEPPESPPESPPEPPNTPQTPPPNVPGTEGRMAA